ncbi:MAG TPA: DUF3368 domain-containing protein [Allocoleopsis sp.]
MIIVSDTTPLSELAKVGQVDLLQGVFRQVIIPREVHDELLRGSHPAIVALQAVDWIEVRTVSDFQKVSTLRAQTQLGLGECGAIILAEELGADRLLLDDQEARREALSRNLPVIGTVGVLLLAKQRGLITGIRQILDDLIAQGTYISQKLYQDVLTQAQE